MKKILITVFTILACSTAFADINSAQERPIQEAKDMKLMEVESSDVINMTLNKSDDSETATSISLLVLRDGSEVANTLLPITNIEEDYCGSIVFVAKLRDNRSIELIDHSQRFCEDFHPYIWEADVTNGDNIYTLWGNPEAI